MKVPYGPACIQHVFDQRSRPSAIALSKISFCQPQGKIKIGIAFMRTPEPIESFAQFCDTVIHLATFYFPVTADSSGPGRIVGAGRKCQRFVATLYSSCKITLSDV